MSTWTLKWDVEMIDVTYGGLFGGEADTFKRYIPGMIYNTLVLPNGTEEPISEEEVEWLKINMPTDEEINERYRVHEYQVRNW